MRKLTSVEFDFNGITVNWKSKRRVNINNNLLTVYRVQVKGGAKVLTIENTTLKPTKKNSKIYIKHWSEEKTFHS